MSDKKDYYDRTYGMSFYMYLQLCTPSKEDWYINAVKIMDKDQAEWFKTTPAKEIVGEKAVQKLVQELNLS